MESIYVVFTKPNTIVSSLIHRFTDRPFTHVGISLEDPFEAFYSFARRYDALPLPGGFVKESLKNINYQSNKNVRVSIIRIPVTAEQKQSMATMLECFEKNKSKLNYNVIGLLLCKTPLTVKRSNHYFCSEFVHEFLATFEICPITKPSQHVKPGDLWDLLNNHEILIDDTIENVINF